MHKRPGGNTIREAVARGRAIAFLNAFNGARAVDFVKALRHDNRPFSYLKIGSGSASRWRSTIAILADAALEGAKAKSVQGSQVRMMRLTGATVRYLEARTEPQRSGGLRAMAPNHWSIGRLVHPAGEAMMNAASMGKGLQKA